MYKNNKVGVEKCFYAKRLFWAYFVGVDVFLGSFCVTEMKEMMEIIMDLHHEDNDKNCHDDETHVLSLSTRIFQGEALSGSGFNQTCSLRRLLRL